MLAWFPVKRAVEVWESRPLSLPSWGTGSLKTGRMRTGQGISGGAGRSLSLGPNLLSFQAPTPLTKEFLHFNVHRLPCRLPNVQTPRPRPRVLHLTLQDRAGKYICTIIRMKDCLRALAGD